MSLHYLLKNAFNNNLILYLRGERGGSVVECRTPEREVRGSRPTAAVLCPWARHFTPRKYWLISLEAMAPSRHDWKIVDWDVKPQHNQLYLRHEKYIPPSHFSGTPNKLVVLLILHWLTDTSGLGGVTVEYKVQFICTLLHMCVNYVEVCMWTRIHTRVNSQVCKYIHQSNRARLLDRKRVRLACKRPRVRSPRPAHSFMETCHENISTAILSLPLIQEEQLSVTGKRMCTKYW